MADYSNVIIIKDERKQKKSSNIVKRLSVIDDLKVKRFNAERDTQKHLRGSLVGLRDFFKGLFLFLFYGLKWLGLSLKINNKIKEEKEK
jgi:hypothetical protein